MARHEPLQPLVIPESDDDTSSVGGDSFNESLTSVKSTIKDYREENGRTYHNLSDGKYHLPNDEKEQGRLEFAHQMWLVTWDGELCNSPKKNGAKRVMDIGTGTGAWAVDYADAFPDSSVIGVDLSPIQPGFVPTNCRFEVDDAEKEWTWEHPFDFVFIRSMIGTFSDWTNILDKAYENLEPGGYIEIQDNGLPIECDDDTLPKDSKILEWTHLLIESTNKIGQSATIVSRLKTLLEEAGFVDVEEKREKWPISPWPEDPKSKELGKWCRSGTMQGVDGISLALFTRVLGWSKEKALAFCADVRKETRGTDIHAYFPVHAVWGRKPERAVTEASV